MAPYQAKGRVSALGSVLGNRDGVRATIFAMSVSWGPGEGSTPQKASMTVRKCQPPDL